jgi:hypothetical protein
MHLPATTSSSLCLFLLLVAGGLVGCHDRARTTPNLPDDASSQGATDTLGGAIDTGRDAEERSSFDGGRDGEATEGADSSTTDTRDQSDTLPRRDASGDTSSRADGDDMDGGRAPDACRTDADCPRKGYECFETINRCRQDCDVLDECPDDLTCVSLRCIEPECRRSEQCPGGQICKDRKCVTGCRKGDCPAPGRVCVEKRCENICGRPKLKQEYCTSDEICTGPSYGCAPAQCTSSDLSNCLDGEICVEGICTPTTGQSCKTDRDCPLQSSCAEKQGVCTQRVVYTCDKGNACPRGKTCNPNTGLCDAN